jgi:hypothetical protein
MMDAHSIITHATHGIAKELADDYEVSLSRMYEILGKDSPYPKAKRLIRKIARYNQDGARLIKADLDAFFAEILTVIAEPTLEELHREAFEAVDSVLSGKPIAVQEKELIELLSICQQKLAGIHKRTELRQVSR